MDEKTCKAYKLAAMKKWRFDSPVGQLQIEDLFELPVTSNTGPSLDTIAIGIANKLRDMEVVSFVIDNNNPKRSELELKLEIIKDVIATKQRQRELARLRRRKQRLLEKLEKLEEENMSADDIKRQLEELEQADNDLDLVA